MAKTTTGLIRRVDDLGRVVIPKEWRDALGLSRHSPVELTYDNVDCVVMVRKYDSTLHCAFCGRVTMLEYKGKGICRECAKQIGGLSEQVQSQKRRGDGEINRRKAALVERYLRENTTTDEAVVSPQ